MLQLKLFLGLCSFLAIQAGYVQVDNYQPSNFADKFNFETMNDPTHGYVNYVDRATAERTGIYKIENNKVYIGVDTQNKASGRGRNSVRLASKTSYNHGLFILDLEHMPGSVCSTWPAFWLVGDNWPNKGEIDIIEGVNNQDHNGVTLHTSDGCVVDRNSGFSGKMETTNCFVKAPGQYDNQGCSISSSQKNTYGNEFNRAGGGVYATDWRSDSIRVWHFPRSQIPNDIKQGNPNPDAWGQPLAKFSGSQCNIDQHFKDQKIVFDITFCGDWAGGVWSQQCGSKGPNCADFVRDNPHEFYDTFWFVNWLKVYRQQ